MEGQQNLQAKSDGIVPDSTDLDREALSISSSAPSEQERGLILSLLKRS